MPLVRDIVRGQFMEQMEKEPEPQTDWYQDCMDRLLPGCFEWNSR